MRILVTGAKGQLGQEFVHLLNERNIKYKAYNSRELDITDEQQVIDIISKDKPTVVYHCAAYTAVDDAEDIGKEKNYLVNVDGTKNVARACELVGATMVYISTDYVFDGQMRDEPYKETDVVSPINEYGKAKYLGEKEVEKYVEKFYIIRTSWVFGEYGKNFVYSMQNLAKNHKTLTIVNDQIGRPTWTKSLADFMLHLVDNMCEYGIYHFSNEGNCTWYEFAKQILKDTDVEVLPISSEEFPQKAKRPEYSVMDLSKVKNTEFSLKSWHDVLIDSNMIMGDK